MNYGIVKQPRKPRSHSEYQLLQLLGEGGQGKVWKARIKETGEIVALKVLKGPFSPEVLKLAHSELAALERISLPTCSPFLSCYYTHFYDSKITSLLIEMEYIDGPNLEDWAKNYQRTYGFKQFLGQMRPLMQDLAAGIKFIHSKNLVHRDLKPANIIIEKRTNSPKIIDFGLACDITCSMPNKKVVCCDGKAGTPQFMAPETAIYGKSGFASDVWGFGATIYRIITGQFVYDLSDAEDFLDAMDIIEESVSPILNTPLPNLNLVVNGCLIRDPSKRITLNEIIRLL